MHAAISGTIDFREPDDEACLERLRRLVEALAGRRTGRGGPLSIASSHLSAACCAVHVSSEYDVRDLLTLHPRSTRPFDEYKAEYGQTLVCGFGRLGGMPVGVVANQQKRVKPADGAAAVRRRHLRRQRRQGRPLRHGLQPDRACRSSSSRTSTASWSAATRSRRASSGPARSW